MFRITISTYWRGIRVIKTWDEPFNYPERFVSVILGFISFSLVIRDTEYQREYPLK